jgi:predicted amidohydrolase YtcJ
MTTVRADLLVTGRIATLAGPAGPGWVDAIAIGRGRVVGAGSVSDVAGLVSPGTRRLVLAPGEVALPGLTDAHLHLAEAALARRRVNLDDARSIDAVLERVRLAAEVAPGADAWIEGAGWDADLLGRWPTAADLETAARGRLVALWAHDHHALLASTRALAESGIDHDRGDPDGGVIRRDEAGHATGVLHETAARLVAGRIPTPGADDVIAALRPMVVELVSLGVVAAHDPGGLSERRDLGGPIEAYRRLAASGDLGLRVHPCVRPEQLDAAAEAGLRSGQPMGPDPLDRLRLGWLKTFADGSLGSRTAALLEPLTRIPDEPEPVNAGYGVWLVPPDELRAQAARAASLGIATQIHGIGDAAVRAGLDALAPTVGRTPLMPRVEHVQLVSTADISRFAALGIAASMQPVHVRSDAEKARRLWGARAEERGYALGALAATGAVIPTGTDAPVEPVDPWPGIACAVTRSAPSWSAGTPPFGPANALDLWRAVRAACVDPAISAGETDRGRLIPGHRADILVMASEAFTQPVETGGALWHARPRMVLLDGRIVAEA